MKKEKRNCCKCGCEFEIDKNNPQKEYCSTLCWCTSNGIDEEQCKRHYMGGHKNIKPKKKK